MMIIEWWRIEGCVKSQRPRKSTKDFGKDLTNFERSGLVSKPKEIFWEVTDKWG
jgi:hypothetical protein